MRAGDDIYVERGMYPHHGIYVHDKQVIHTDNAARITCTTDPHRSQRPDVNTPDVSNG